MSALSGRSLQYLVQRRGGQERSSDASAIQDPTRYEHLALDRAEPLSLPTQCSLCDRRFLTAYILFCSLFCSPRRGRAKSDCLDSFVRSSVRRGRFSSSARSAGNFVRPPGPPMPPPPRRPPICEICARDPSRVEPQSNETKRAICLICALPHNIIISSRLPSPPRLHPLPVRLFLCTSDRIDHSH